MFCNWGLEANKWRFMLKPLQKISFSQALKSIFAGCAVTIITPNRTGEFGGRILFVEPQNRLKAISISIVGSISQTLITFLFGCIGLLFFLSENFRLQDSYTEQLLHHPLIFWLTILIAVILLILFFYENAFWRLCTRIPIIKKYVHVVSIGDLYSFKALLRILFYSFLRYVIFILQYVIILSLMKVEIPNIEILSLTSVFFLCLALAPTFGFIELPVRSELAIGLFGIYSNNLLGLQCATLSIWLINIVFPAIIGLFIILFTKYSYR